MNTNNTKKTDITKLVVVFNFYKLFTTAKKSNLHLGYFKVYVFKTKLGVAGCDAVLSQCAGASYLVSTMTA